MKRAELHTREMQDLLAQIPYGKVITYKDLAHAMNTKGYRYIGQLLNKNPDPEAYPCFKVVNSNGDVGGFAYGCADKIKRLEAEGIEVKNNKIVDFTTKHYIF